MVVVVGAEVDGGPKVVTGAAVDEDTEDQNMAEDLSEDGDRRHVTVESVSRFWSHK